MKVNKTQSVLFIYSLLLEKKEMAKKDIMNYLEINELTFYRYIQEIRAFLFNFNYSKELIYERNEDKYYLVDPQVV